MGTFCMVRVCSLTWIFRGNIAKVLRVLRGEVGLCGGGIGREAAGGESCPGGRCSKLDMAWGKSTRLKTVVQQLQNPAKRGQTAVV